VNFPSRFSSLGGRGGLGGDKRGARPVQPPDGLVDLGVRHDERRQQPHHVLAGADGEQTLVMAGAMTSVLGTRHLSPIISPSPRTSSMTAGCLAASCPSSRARCRPAASTRSRNPRASTTSSTALPTAMASGLPPKVEPWLPGRHAGRSPLGGQARPHRKAAADALGDRHDVGADAGAFMGETAARCGPCRTAPRRAPAAGRARRKAGAAPADPRPAAPGYRPRPGPAPPERPRSPARWRPLTAPRSPNAT
jgi:hypothetical protein